jgi:hypothetical protein
MGMARVQQKALWGLLGIVTGFMFLISSFGFAQDASDSGPATGLSNEKVKPNFDDRVKAEEKQRQAPVSSPQTPNQTDPEAGHGLQNRFGVPLPKP